MCNKPSANLISIFAMDKNIIDNALKSEGIPEAKVDEYLEKIVNLPIHPKMPKKINKLIDRFFGTEENDTKIFLKNKYKNAPFNPRKLANIRYLDHMVYSIYGDMLKYNDNYIDLLDLQNGQEKTWEYLTDDETRRKYEYKIGSRDNLSIEAYRTLEQKALLYVQNLYNYEINSNIRINNINNAGQSIVLDGIVNMPEKDILLEIKYARDIASIKKVYKMVVEQLISTANIFNSSKNIELMPILIVDGIEDKNNIAYELNIELQNDLKLTKYSGMLILLSKNKLTD